MNKFSCFSQKPRYQKLRFLIRPPSSSHPFFLQRPPPHNPCPHALFFPTLLLHKPLLIFAPHLHKPPWSEHRFSNTLFLILTAPFSDLLNLASSVRTLSFTPQHPHKVGLCFWAGLGSAATSHSGMAGKGGRPGSGAGGQPVPAGWRRRDRRVCAVGPGGPYRPGAGVGWPPGHPSAPLGQSAPPGDHQSRESKPAVQRPLCSY